ncbi:HNH endonuclease signature motif containing protein [Yersinia rochesterensis]|uniref:HNH endonuclease signature motif containing protein n=1 Tax=Yersinia TaxID=629 RepID=UPI0021E6DE69|nr:MULTISPECIES: HNH endonuclease signature motif containing protein [Yersinia]EKN3949049.1 HNH endonuclease [Yersinia enterocolitica]MDA5544388.1 HNH endonuclease signature motif containing protein [Yersinia rochesterensis]UYJ98512.1 HNH endonuclease [Yersinia enterocolitica]UZM74050.1 HNH endonuclease [Yersinia sp. SCPM-O-B-9106 (C-191)]
MEVESGHCCSIKGCNEHTYLEIHHIDENRNNNKQENLIVLCDKHHKMAHANVIDRKALKQYKALLVDSHVTLIAEKLEELKALIVQEKVGTPEPEKSVAQPADERVVKHAATRSEVLNFALYHVAIAHFEKEYDLFFEHQVQFTRDATSLTLDALRQDDDLSEDIILDVHYLRKPYMDATVYGSLIAKKLEIYELLTGRPARGVLIAVVGRERMLEGSYLDMTRNGVESCNGKVQLQIYSCEQIGFHPGAVSAALFASNLKKESSSVGELNG